MARRLALASCALAAHLATPAGAIAQPAFPSHDVNIVVTARAGGSFAVLEDYTLTRPLDNTIVEMLGDPCTDIGPITGRINGDGIQFAWNTEARGPWTVLRAHAPASSRAGQSFLLEYTVTPRGAQAVIPIAMPASTLEPAPGLRGADVVLHVQIASAADRVVTPRVEMDSTPETWVGRMLAVPSSVRIDIAQGAQRCSAQMPGTTGGLEWRFAIFVATMGVWVPLYLLWFGRRQD